MFGLILVLLPVDCRAILVECSVHAIIVRSRFSVALLQAHLCIFSQFIVALLRPRTQFIVVVAGSLSLNLSSRLRAQFFSIYCCASQAPIFIVAPVAHPSSALPQSSAHLCCCAHGVSIFIVALVKRPSSLLRPSRAYLHHCAGQALIFIVAPIACPSSLLRRSSTQLYCRACHAPILIVVPVEHPSLSPRLLRPPS